MLFWVIVKVGIKSLWANKLRSLLAMLGIIIGVAAVISMLSMGAGAQRQVMNRISAMGTNLLVIRAGQSHSHGVVSGVSQKLTLADAAALAAEVKDIERLAPAVSRDSQVKYMNRNTRVSVIGTSITYLPIRDLQVEKGRGFTEVEADSSGRVAVLGPVTASNLFDQNDPVGQTVKLNGINFKVVGVIKSKGDQGYYNPDDQMVIPYTTAMKQVFGVDYLREIDVQAREGADLSKVQADITELLRKRHRTQPGQSEDFQIRNQADILQTASEITQTFTFLLGGIASISLLVGGIGIMNIMLVSVTERTREIGIRMAIGAKRSNILLQFLIEAVIISGLGGLIGVLVGVAGAKIIPMAQQQFTTVLEVHSMMLALSFSALVGIFFGWYPAQRAAKLNPIDALRYE